MAAVPARTVIMKAAGSDVDSVIAGNVVDGSVCDSCRVDAAKGVEIPIRDSSAVA
jgi:hypothetical protein